MVAFPACREAATSGWQQSVHNMIDVLVFLFENYFDLGAHPEPDALARKLSAAGFDGEEISLALGWLDDLKLAAPEPLSAAPGSFRVFTAEENARLADESLNFIAFLESAGVISAAQRELIIDRALALTDDVIPVEKLKIVVLMVLWSQAQTLEPLIIEELLSANSDAILH